MFDWNVLKCLSKSQFNCVFLIHFPLSPDSQVTSYHHSTTWEETMVLNCLKCLPFANFTETHTTWIYFSRAPPRSLKETCSYETPDASISWAVWSVSPCAGMRARLDDFQGHHYWRTSYLTQAKQGLLHNVCIVDSVDAGSLFGRWSQHKWGNGKSVMGKEEKPI